MDKLQEKIGYHFKDENLLKQALTHSSYANTFNVPSYERLEFLGDSILSLIISEHIYLNYAHKEGQLSKMRASIVCEQSLSECSTNLEIGNYMLLSKGEELTGGRTRSSILADIFEAVLAAIYLDGGIKPSRKFVFDFLSDTIILAAKGEVNKDYKTTLQELAQANNTSPLYELIDAKGPEHNKTFIAQVLVDDKVIGKGNGRNKKEAEQMAAKEGLKHYKNQ